MVAYLKYVSYTTRYTIWKGFCGQVCLKNIIYYIHLLGIGMYVSTLKALSCSWNKHPVLLISQPFSGFTHHVPSPTC